VEWVPIVWEEWQPDPSTVCEGEFEQYRYNNCGEYETKLSYGTKPTVWGDWQPDPSTVCLGYYFDKYRINNCGDYQFDWGIGTGPIIWGDWEPNPSTICAGTPFDQYRSNNCGDYESQPSTGTGVTTWGDWYPDTNPSNVCYDQTFTQDRYDSVCGNTDQRTVNGTAQPVWGNWTPDPSTVDIGVAFTQTIYDSSVCGKVETRPAVGTKMPCIASNTTNMGDVVVPITYQEYLNYCARVDSGGFNVSLSQNGYQYTEDGGDPNFGWGRWTNNISGSFTSGGFGGYNRCSIGISGNVSGTTTHTGNPPPTPNPNIYAASSSANITINFRTVGGQMYMGISVGFGNSLTSDPAQFQYDTGFGPGTATVLGYTIPVVSRWCPDFSRECSQYAPPVYQNTITNSLIVS
jgi:hypothetical protein